MTDTTFPKATPEEARRLIAAGYFGWGRGHWIHDRRLGRVLTTKQALARVRKKVR